MSLVARLGDLTSHKGVLVAPVRTDVLTNDRPTAHIGTAIFCPAGTPSHGFTVVVTGKPSVLVGGIPIATVGSVTTCKAVVVTGSGDVRAG